MNRINDYEDQVRASSYAKLDFPGDYYLAYRDIPGLIEKHIYGNRALDFGCGTGRSTRFLKNLGFDVTGIDISEKMINIAKSIEPSGEYMLVKSGEFGELYGQKFDLILSMFTFDNIPDHSNRCHIVSGLNSLLNNNGKIIMVDSTPELYYNEWLSFSTKPFRENLNAKCGDPVYVIMKDVEDERPVKDYIWFDKDYRRLFNAVDLNITESVKPLGKDGEPFDWINEKKISPWVIYVLERPDHKKNYN